MKYVIGFVGGMLALGMVVAVLYVVQQYQIVPRSPEQSNEPRSASVTRSMIQGTATPPPYISPSPKGASPSLTLDEDQGIVTVSGALGYPSSFIPAMKICLYEYAEPGMIQGPKYCTYTQDNQSTYSISGTIIPSKYVVFAWPSSGAVGSALAGSYTPAVACGLSVECTDHSPLPLDLTDRVDVQDADIRDWYAPEGIFPVKPTEDGSPL